MKFRRDQLDWVRAFARRREVQAETTAVLQAARFELFRPAATTFEIANARAEAVKQARWLNRPIPIETYQRGGVGRCRSSAERQALSGIEAAMWRLKRQAKQLEPDDAALVEFDVRLLIEEIEEELRHEQRASMTLRQLRRIQKQPIYEVAGAYP